MDFSKVKLVVSDMDGTLLNTNHEVSDRFFELHDLMKAKNIHFVAASGRQYHSIISKLKPIKKDITVIAENGAFAMQDNTELFNFGVDKKLLDACATIFRGKEKSGMVLCGKKHAYLESSNPEFINTFSQFYSNYKVVDHFEQVTDDVFFKLAVYHGDCSEEFLYPQVAHMEKDLHVLISGKNWLDISSYAATKGNALEKLQSQLGVTPAETMAFGDYNNDLSMLALAHFSFAMQNAHPKVKQVANYETLSNDDRGVEAILEKLIA